MNAILLFGTRRLVPDAMPLVAPAPRKVVSMSSPEAVGITPYVLAAPQPAVQREYLIYRRSVARH